MMTTNPSYAADFMLITLPPGLATEIIVENDTKLDLSNPTCASLFLHEWLHYVHNVSTLNGLYAFASIINMWANFRSKLNEQGISVAVNELDEYSSSSVKRTHHYRMGARRQQNNPQFLKQSTGSFIILSVTSKTAPIPARILGCEAELTTVIQCEIEIDNHEFVAAEIGIVEILEGLAFMLEERFLRAYGQLPTSSFIAPYRLLSKLARHVVQDIEDDDVIACALTSLQSDDPPKLLMEILDNIKSYQTVERSKLIKKIAKVRLFEYSSLIQEVLTQTKKLFPISEPMGDLVNEVLHLMNEKLILRYKEPFFELLMLDQVKNEPPELRSIRLGNIIAEFSCPRILAVQSGDANIIGRDQILNFGNRESITGEYQFGQQKLHAALHYLWLHLSEEGFLNTEAVPESQSRRRCPFYTACTHQLRSDEAELCASKPWESLKIPTDPRIACWYRAGVRATRPPQEDPLN